MRPAEQCASPLRGTIFYSPSAGADPVTQLNMDLDNPGIPASYQETYQVNGVTEGKAAADYFGHNTVSLGNGEQFTFDIHASTATHYCRFSLAMTVVDGTKTVTENVDDHGVPFQVTAVYGIKKDLVPSFSRYSAVYLGGVATPRGDDGWTRVSPARAQAALGM